MLTKVILFVVLVVIALYLYRRTQAVAKQELDKKAPNPEQTQSPVDNRSESTATEADQVVELTDAASSEPNATPDAVTTVDAEPELEPKPEEIIAAEPEPEPEPEVESETEVEPESEPKPEVISATDTPAEPHAVAASESDKKPISLAPVKGEWASDSFKQLVEAANNAGEPQAQHDAVADVVSHCYKMRKQADYCQYGAALKALYLDLFRVVYQQHDASGSDEIKAPAFMQLSTLLNDTGEFDQAISVCQLALEYQLTDGTVTGFEGRISRIEKAKAKAS
ncbi:hypothetical protein GCM10009347_30060 [Shewanella algicola]|uniref:Uncharacterized protein n=1 Tax=Shewanella algicola TaxID=640633 RepID=A0A9X1Z7S5_9GAMM|nr:hypothetical protein [Shewanella algicola]MCL1106702.1 hypothetical protein [Shewanella algicola]GGP61835.1 hypothetical protein GCM10009347_30060 [Shewanella algicola]